MNKQEILTRLKPVLDAELYSAIETVFKNEDKLQNVVAVLKDALDTTANPNTKDSSTKYTDYYKDAREMRETQDWYQR